MTDSPRKVREGYDAPQRVATTTKANDKQQQLFRAAYEADSDRFLHLWHEELSDEERAALLSSAIRDCRGRSLLALCVFAQNLRLATFLVEQGADLTARVMAQSKCCVLDEAVLLRDLDMVQLIVSNTRDRAHNESSQDFKVLLEQLKRLPDIYLEFAFNVSITNLLFFLNPLMPSDQYRVFKKGKKIRFDFTLAGFTMRWIHKDQTIIVKDCTCCETPSVLLTHILHPEKIYSQQCMSKYKTKGQKAPLGSKPEKKSSPVAKKQENTSRSEPIATNSQQNSSDSKSIQFPDKKNAKNIRRLIAEESDDNEEAINKYFDKMVIESIVNGPIIHFSHHPEKIRFVPIKMNFFESTWEKTKNFFKSNNEEKSQPGRIRNYEVEGMFFDIFKHKDHLRFLPASDKKPKWQRLSGKEKELTDGASGREDILVQSNRKTLTSSNNSVQNSESQKNISIPSGINEHQEWASVKPSSINPHKTDVIVEVYGQKVTSEQYFNDKKYNLIFDSKYFTYKRKRLSITTSNDRSNLPLVHQFILPVLDVFKKKNVMVGRLREFLTSENLPGLPVKISLHYKIFYCTFEFKNLFNEQGTQPGVKYNSMGDCEIAEELFTVPTSYKKVKYEELMSHLKFDYGSMFAQISEHI